MSRAKDLIRHSKYKVLVTSNVFNIPKRLKKIDKDYFVVWNSQNEKFEVHSEGNVGSSYCFTVPYPELDSRTLDYCKMTSVAARGEEIFREMERHNAELEKANERQFRENLKDIAHETSSLFQKAAWDTGA